MLVLAAGRQTIPAGLSAPILLAGDAARLGLATRRGLSRSRGALRASSQPRRCPLRAPVPTCSVRGISGVGAWVSITEGTQIGRHVTECCYESKGIVETHNNKNMKLRDFGRCVLDTAGSLSSSGFKHQTDRVNGLRKVTKWSVILKNAPVVQRVRSLPPECRMTVGRDVMFDPEEVVT